MSEDTKDSILRRGVPLRSRDSGIEIAKERERTKRVRLRRGGFEPRLAEFTARAGNNIDFLSKNRFIPRLYSIQFFFNYLSFIID